MDGFVLNIFTAGSGDDAEGWMNILLFVVLAVFWAVGGIIKAASQKKENKQKQQPPRKPVRKTPSSVQTRASSSERPSRTPQVRPQTQPRVSRAPELAKVLRSKIFESSGELESASAKLHEKLIPQNIPALASKPLVELDSMRPDRPQRKTEPEEELSELDFNYADADELMKAILHIEILGSPVSLRDPSRQNTGF